MPSVDRPLTTAQRDLLVDVQFKRRVLAGRDTLYAAVKQHLQRTGSDVPMPTKVQIAAWLKNHRALAPCPVALAPRPAALAPRQRGLAPHGASLAPFVAVSADI